MSYFKLLIIFIAAVPCTLLGSAKLDECFVRIFILSPEKMENIAPHPKKYVSQLSGVKVDGFFTPDEDELKEVITKFNDVFSSKNPESILLKKNPELNSLKKEFYKKQIHLIAINWGKYQVQFAGLASENGRFILCNIMPAASLSFVTFPREFDLSIQRNIGHTYIFPPSDSELASFWIVLYDLKASEFFNFGGSQE